MLVPAGALSGLPAAQIEALLLHELAHIRRHDFPVHLLQSAVEAVFFYHPAVWWISSHMRSERELCCDDIAVSITGDAIVYARALAEFDSARSRQATVMAANGGSVAGRIARLLGQSSNCRRDTCGSGSLVLILFAIGAWALLAQPTVRPQFEVASVKPSINRSVMNVRPLPGRLTADASLRMLVQYAYGVQPFQVVGASGWMQAERYQIEAKADGNASRDRMFLMLQSLLADRFQLKTRRGAGICRFMRLWPQEAGPSCRLPGKAAAWTPPRTRPRNGPEEEWLRQARLRTPRRAAARPSLPWDQVARGCKAEKWGCQSWFGGSRCCLTGA